MRVVTILGSPKPHGNTAAVLTMLEDQLKLGGHDADRIHVVDHEIGGCKGCYACPQSQAFPECAQADAADITQEVLIKMIARLSAFRAESSFRTWLYRIAANHIMNMARRPREYPFSSLESHGRLIDTTPDAELP
jgi:hypothetical protein